MCTTLLAISGCACWCDEDKHVKICQPLTAWLLAAGLLGGHWSHSMLGGASLNYLYPFLSHLHRSNTWNQDIKTFCQMLL